MRGAGIGQTTPTPAIESLYKHYVLDELPEDATRGLYKDRYGKLQVFASSSLLIGTPLL
jgi:hypothetical protein